MSIIDLLNKSESAYVHSVSLHAGEVLFREGDICECIGIVDEGKLEIISYDYEGKEIIYNSLTEGGIFGNNLLFSSDPTYKGNVMAVRSSMLSLIYRDDLVHLLQNNSDFLGAYLRIQSDFGKSLNSRIRLLSYDGVAERLFYAMAEHGDSLPFSSVSALARELNVSREALSRTLHALEKEKRIMIRRKMITSV